MISRKVAGVLISATALIGMGLSTSVVASADDPTFQATGSAVTKDNCTWTVSGVPASLSLAPAGAAKYDGSEMTLSSANADTPPGSIQVFASGAHQSGGSATVHKDCTWFSNDDRESIAVTLSTTSVAFSASAATGGADVDMNFSVNADNPLSASLTGTCKINGVNDTTLKWDSAGFSLSSANADTPYSTNILSLAKTDVTTFPDEEESAGDSCSKAQVWSVKIPAGQKPTYPTETYTFAGPSISYSYTHP